MTKKFLYTCVKKQVKRYKENKTLNDACLCGTQSIVLKFYL